MAYPYQKHVWVTKEIIRREYLQNIEDGIYDEQQERLTQEDALSQAIADEESRARRSEVDLTNAINTEKNRATAAESSLSDSIAAERTRALSVEGDLRTDLNDGLSSLGSRVTDEVSRAQSAESTLTSNLSAEVTRAQNAESVLTSNLSAEITRAQGAESTLTTNLANEVSRAQDAESTLTTNLNAEIARATAAEAAITAKVTVAYKASGSVYFANLPSATEERQGNVYDIKDAFVTTNDFVEGSGHDYPAGTNVVIIGVTENDVTTYMYDVLPGFVDTSDFVTNTDYATSQTPGLVKPDGSTTTVDANGTITVIGGGGGDAANFIGTSEEWEELTPTEQNQYKSRDITDDYNGTPIDNTPTDGSPNAVSSGGVYDALCVKFIEVTATGNNSTTFTDVWNTLASNCHTALVALEDDEIATVLGVAFNGRITRNVETTTYYYYDNDTRSDVALVVSFEGVGSSFDVQNVNIVPNRSSHYVASIDSSGATFTDMSSNSSGACTMKAIFEVRKKS